MKIVSTNARPHPGPLPEERENLFPPKKESERGISQKLSIQSLADVAAASPGGEGRGEGGFRKSNSLSPANRQKHLWRSLDEFQNTPSFQETLHREFPENASEFTDALSRRNFLKLMGASIAFAGTTACRQPIETIVPYVRQPEEMVPGKPWFYATSMCLGGYAKGVLVESHEGRPTKIEGNPDHPASLGATDIFAQASILDLYDPNRSKTVLQNQKPSDWNAFQKSVSEILRSKNGAGIRILTQTITSPTLAAQLGELKKQFPGARWNQWEPLNRDNVRAGTKLAFGQFLEPQYHFDKAEIVVSLDGDFFSDNPGSVRYARDFMKLRRVNTSAQKMNRLYAIESISSLVGAMADHRLAVRASEIEHFAWALLDELKTETLKANPANNWIKWLRALSRDLRAHRGRSLFYAGEFQSPHVHALAHLLNLTLQNVGQTLDYIEPPEARPEIQTDSLRELVSEMQGGKVELLLMLEGNPVYNAPADFSFAAALQKVKHAIHFGLHENETSALCEWHLPAAHYLESWSDARAFDGIISFIQPLIAPLHDGKSAHEILAMFQSADELPSPESAETKAGARTSSARSAHEIVRQFWKTKHSKTDFETWWKKSLHDGVLAETKSKPVETNANAESILDRLARNTELSKNEQPDSAWEIIFRPDATIRDGEFANNGWLQELPKALTQLTWDNPVLISPRTAEKLNLSNGDVVEISNANFRSSRGDEAYSNGDAQSLLTSAATNHQTVRAPVWILPGHADDCITVTLGYGRERCGRVGRKRGFDFYPLRTSDALWQSGGWTIRKTGVQYPLACTQGHQNMQGRDLVRVRTAAISSPSPPSDGGEGRGEEVSVSSAPLPARSSRRNGEDLSDNADDSLYPGFKYEGNAWGMAIDLNACIGCKACTIACQSENNIAVVGKEQVLRGREMHWIRVDRYFSGNPDSPKIFHQPVPCMHCENAPCEVVCPVAATSHSAEGLNEMTYNRCIGTRYCSNNCPYKVRRFNFLQFSDQKTESYKLMRNPNVTVRSRGVMEKCTYCVQRINVARIQAKKENREIRDGEIVTACQAVCPTEAIVFGNINDPASKVSKQKASPLNYGLLTELNTRPRTTYLERVRNPNPELEASAETTND